MEGSRNGSAHDVPSGAGARAVTARRMGRHFHPLQPHRLRTRRVAPHTAARALCLMALAIAGCAVAPSKRLETGEIRLMPVRSWCVLAKCELPRALFTVCLAASCRVVDADAKK